MSYIILKLNEAYKGKSPDQLREYLNKHERIRIKELHGVRLTKKNAVFHVWGQPDEVATNYISGMGRIVRIDPDDVTEKKE